MRLQKQKQVIILMSAIVLGAILVFWLFIYSPKNKEMKSLKKELSEIKNSISNFQKISGSGESLDVVIEKYDRMLKQLKLRLPSQEEASIRELAKEAAKLGIEVVSISPRTAVETKLPVKVKGCRCRELKICMHLRTTYFKLGNYVEVARAKFPSVVRLNNLNIKSLEKGAGARLDVLIDITLYMLVPEV